MKTKEDWKNITKEELYQLALVENTPDGIIADMYGITKNMVTYKRHKFDLRITPSCEAYRRRNREQALKAMNIIPDSSKLKEACIRSLNNYFDELDRQYSQEGVV